MPATRRKDNLSTGVSAHGTMSENITTTGGGIVRYIKSCREPVLREGEIRAPLRSLEGQRLTPTREAVRAYVGHPRAVAFHGQGGAVRRGRDHWCCA